MNENGIVNIYMIVLSYIFSPNTQMDEDIIIDDDGIVSKSDGEKVHDPREK